MCQSEEIKRLREENRDLRNMVAKYENTDSQIKSEATYKDVVNKAHVLMRTLDAFDQQQAIVELQYLVFRDLGDEIFGVNLDNPKKASNAVVE